MIQHFCDTCYLTLPHFEDIAGLHCLYCTIDMRINAEHARHKRLDTQEE